MDSIPLASKKTGEETIKWNEFCCYGKPQSVKKKKKSKLCKDQSNTRMIKGNYFWVADISVPHSFREGRPFFYIRAGDHPREHLWTLSMLTESKLFRHILMCSSIMAVHKSHVLKRLNKGRNELISFLLLVSPPLLQPGLWDFAFLLVSDWQ